MPTAGVLTSVTTTVMAKLGQHPYLSKQGGFIVAAELLHHRRHQDGVPRASIMIAGPHREQIDDPWHPSQFAQQMTLQHGRTGD